jgi:hypothetical protein
MSPGSDVLGSPLVFEGCQTDYMTDSRQNSRTGMASIIAKTDKFSTMVSELTPVVELVGPAGGGKTSIAKVLEQHCSCFQLAIPPHSRRIQNVPFFLKYSFAMLPIFWGLMKKRPMMRLRLQEIALMVILKGWHQILCRAKMRSGKILILDQGPVFMLGWLYGFSPDILRSREAEEWWASMYSQWAGLLDIAIWLDAPDEVLVDRVRNRQIWHGNKIRSNPEAFRFLACWRDSLNHVLSKLEAKGEKLKVLRYNTAIVSLEDTVEGICTALGLKKS